jgi:hypothetical protein
MNSVYIDSAVAASPIYIGPTNANSVIIGNATAPTTVNGALVMGTGKNITLQPTSGYVAPSTIAQLGGYVEVPFTSNISFTSTSSNFAIATITIGTPGVYVINYGFRYHSGSSTTTLTFIQSWFNTSTQTGNSASTQYGNSAICFSPALTNPDAICQNGTGIVTVTSTSTITFYGFAKYTGTAPIFFAGNSYYSYIRIA